MTQGSTQYLRFRLAMLFIRLSTHTVADPPGNGKMGGGGDRCSYRYRYSTGTVFLRDLKCRRSAADLRLSSSV